MNKKNNKISLIPKMNDFNRRIISKKKIKKSNKKNNFKIKRNKFKQDKLKIVNNNFFLDKINNNKPIEKKKNKTRIKINLFLLKANLKNKKNCIRNNYKNLKMNTNSNENLKSLFRNTQNKKTFFPKFINSKSNKLNCEINMKTNQKNLFIKTIDSTIFNENKKNIKNNNCYKLKQKFSKGLFKFTNEFY